MVVDFLNEFAQKNNLIFGVCSTVDLPEIVLPKAPFVNYSAFERVNPKLTMPNVESIIVLGCSYNKKISFKFDKNLRGNFSISAVGKDYHDVLSEHLFNLANLIRIKTGYEFDYKIFVDTGPLNERMLAVCAGLGFIGKNQCVISEKFGSMFFIGYMMTDLKLPVTKLNNNKSCGLCRKCIDACPGKALSEDGFDYTKCVSYLTQKKSKLSSEEINKIGKQLYGCDVCQIVCPYNFYKNGEINCIDDKMPTIESILMSSNNKLRERYKNTAVGWRTGLLKRNALCVLANSSKDEIMSFISDENRKEIVRRESEKWDIGIPGV